MIARRRTVVALGAAVLAVPLAAFAQSRAKINRIGFLGLGTESADFADRLGAVRAGLAELGHVEGKNLVIEYRWAEGKYDRLDALAEELVRSQVAVIVTYAPPGGRAAKRATSTIPIVVAVVGDAVESGLVPNLARPGGNITGLSFFAPEVAAKRVELLKEALPGIRLIAVLGNPQNPGTMAQFDKMAAMARSKGADVQRFDAKDRDELAPAFDAMSRSRVDAVVLTDEPLMGTNAAMIAGLAQAHKLPMIGAVPMSKAGSLMGNGPDLNEMFRRSATYIDKILKGAKPGDLAMEQPTKFEIVVNLKTAKTLGLTIPPSVLLRADRIIE